MPITERKALQQAQQASKANPWASLDRAGLRRYGLMMSSVIALLFGLALPWLLSRPWPICPWVLAAAFLLAAMLAPSALAPVYNAWMRLGLMLGWINSRIILSVLFFLIITPTGWLLRLFGKDPMQRQRQPQQSSYRTPSKATRPDHMNHPY